MYYGMKRRDILKAQQRLDYYVHWQLKKNLSLKRAGALKGEGALR